MSATPANASTEPRLQNLFIVIGLVWLGLVAIAATGYPNLMDNERRIGAYVLDAVHNGHWLIQRDETGEVASKPPLLTWIAALATLAYGRVTGFAVHLPSALGTLGVACLLLRAGRQRFGWHAGFFASLTYLLSPVADKQVFTARYDGLFAFPVTFAALAAFGAWNRERGWIAFWFWSAVATLVKGPLGLILAVAGLLAAFWEWRSGNPLRPRGNHLTGILLYLAICGGWFALAYWQMGQPLVDKMIGRELLRHSIGEEQGRHHFYEATVNGLTNYLPWSILGVVALWRVCRSPSPQATTRRFERFLFCWFVAGLILFSVSPHQSGRLIFPLLPALALLTGCELQRWLAALPAKTISKLVVATMAFALIAMFLNHHYRLRHTHQTKETLAMRTLAGDIRDRVGEQFPFTYVDSPFAVQFYLNTYRPNVSAEAAVKLLQGDAAAFVVVCDLAALQRAWGGDRPAWSEVLSQPLNRDEVVHIVSNHPRLEWVDHMAAIIGPFSLRMDGVKLLRARGEEFVFERREKMENAVTFSNLAPTRQRVRVRFSHSSTVQERELAPGGTWKL
jgi:hypothetical protein